MCMPPGKDATVKTQGRQVKAFKHVDREAKRQVMAQQEIRHATALQFAASIHASHQLGPLHENFRSWWNGEALDVTVPLIGRASTQRETETRKMSDAEHTEFPLVRSAPFEVLLCLLLETMLDVLDLPCIVDLSSHEKPALRFLEDN